MNILRQLLYLRKDDRKVLFVLIAVIALSTCGVYYLGGSSDASVSVGDSLASQAVGHTAQRRSYRDDAPIAVDAPRHEIFSFDPNTADSTALLRLGLPRWQVRSIYRYRAHGGVYRCKEDFAQLRGLTLKQYRELEPYIVIAPQYRPASEFVHRPGYSSASSSSSSSTSSSSSSSSSSPTSSSSSSPMSSSSKHYAKLSEGETIDLASMDTLQYRMVPGIGSVLARSILSRGKRLGGYASVSQLMEVSGFPASALQYFRLSNPQVQKININKLSLDRLRAHPYINFYMARDITEYRHKHGAIRSLSELSLLPTFTPDVIKRLEPYVEY